MTKSYLISVTLCINLNFPDVWEKVYVSARHMFASLWTVPVALAEPQWYLGVCAHGVSATHFIHGWEPEGPETLSN